MDTYPNNSHTAKEAKVSPLLKPVPSPEEPRKIESVVTGEVVRRKKPFGKRFVDVFGGEDARSVGGYIFWDVILPSTKDIIADVVSQGIERILFGETRPPTRKAGRFGASRNGYVSYDRFATSREYRPEPTRPPISRRARAVHDFDEIILETKAEAEAVLARLFDLVQTYATATVADLYELVGITGNYTDGQWGWSDLRGASVTRLHGGGYLLDLPRPQSLRD
jgi:hypothetical protein